jgi:hypothetical protein
MPFVSSIRGTFGPASENRGVADGGQVAELLRQDPNSPGLPTGGTITTAGGYRIHTFTDTGTTSFNLNSISSLNVEYLVVAGGGGSAPLGGGAGAGGYRTGTLNGLDTPRTVTVGAGSFGRSDYPGALPNSSNGLDSVFDSITSIGGAKGGAYTTVGAPGGSGSGAGAIRAAGGGGAGGAGSPATGPTGSPYGGGSGTSGQGNPGGNAYQQYPTPGGGGPGGAGVASSITGSSVVRAGGGGGSVHGPGSTYHPGSGGAGGAGGGGAGQKEPGVAGGNGLVNTGGGAGGCGYPGPTPGSTGGPGIVVVRYLL